MVQNLGLGVFEDRSKASADMSDSDSDSSDTSSSSDSDADLESSDGSSIIGCDALTFTRESRPIKPLPKRGSVHPGIVVLDSSSGS